MAKMTRKRKVMTQDQMIRAVQQHLGIPVDGIAGRQTWGAIIDGLGVERVTAPADRPPSQFPGRSYSEMVAYYGKPGDESNLTTIIFPYPMRLYTRQAPATYKKNFGIHKKLKESLEEIFVDLLAVFGNDGIKEHGLDVFGGIYNNRSVRGGKSKSKHAWGAAIDLNPAENRNQQSWHQDRIGINGYASMPVEAIKVFEKHGWMSGAREWGRDAMHFQATS